MKNKHEDPIPNSLNVSIENMVIQCAQNPEMRSELFFKIGQQFLKPLDGRELEEKTFEIFKFMIQHDKEWKGSLLMPEYYRQDKVNSNFRDMWYTVKDYIAWCIFYPQEVSQNFKHEDNGNISIVANPKVRIMDKDNTKQVYKSKLGESMLVPVKKDRSFQIPSGFTLGQKDSILTVVVAGLLKLPESLYHKPKSKEFKKETFEKIQEEDYDSQFMEKENPEMLETENIDIKQLVKKTKKKSVKNLVKE